MNREFPYEVQRVRDIFFRLGETETIELKSLLRGEVSVELEASLEVIVPNSGRARSCSLDELQLLLRIPPSGPISGDQLAQRLGIQAEEIESLLSEGFLLEAAADQRSTASTAWDPVASAFHTCCLNQAGGEAARLDLEAKRRDAASEFNRYIEKYGRPPAVALEYRTKEGSRSDRTLLPLGNQADDDFFRLMRRRRTCRHFTDAAISLTEAATLLRCTFGVQATASFGNYLVALKASPSGGSIHPAEAFPLVLSVQGLDPGLYHYNGFDHALEPIRFAPRSAVRDLAIRLASGQEFVGGAAMLVLLVARVDRNHWKYPNSCRTYAVMHQDVGHLSQTFYLTAAQLGLGAFYTAALAGSVARDLGLDDHADAPLGLSGCGYPDLDKLNWLEAKPFEPRSQATQHDVETRWVEDPTCPSVQLGESGEATPSELYFRDVRLSPSLEEE